MLQGLLLVDKPKGWTSHDVVHFVRRLIAEATQVAAKQVKVGHTGTLDPQASGLLVMLIGSYTKRASELLKLDKAYGVTMQLGTTSTTGDQEGHKTLVSIKQPTPITITRILDEFTGQLSQTPPVYSAIKVHGQRAYSLARQGKPVALTPRPVTVYRNHLIRYSYPIIQFDTTVSSGTYIRSLVSDIGQRLGTGAYMSELRRTAVGQFRLDDALPPDRLTFDRIKDRLVTLV